MTRIKQMTAEEYFNTYGVDPTVNPNSQTASATRGFASGLTMGIKNTIGDITQIGTEVKDSAIKGMDRMQEIAEAQRAGEQGGIRSTFQRFGAGAKFGANVIGSTIKGGIKALLPQKAEEAIKTGVQKVAEPIITSAPVQSIVEFYDSLDDAQKRDVDSVLGIGQLALSVKGAQSLGKTGVRAVRGTASATKRALPQIKAQVVNTSDDVLAATKKIFSSSKATIGNRVLPIPKQVQTALKRSQTPTIKKYLDQARQATLDQKASTPLELAGARATEALGTIQNKIEQIGSQKATVLNKAAVSRKPMGKIALKARQDINRMFNLNNLDKTDQALVNTINARLKALGSNPTLKQVDDFVDFAQEQIYKGANSLTLQIGSKTEAGLRKIVGQVNSQVKSAAPRGYARLNKKYASLFELREKLNNALGADASKGGSLLKRVFSSTDGGTKKMFEQILKETGIDLTDEATLAKFAMELFGDVRQRSLLENLQIPSSIGLIKEATTGTARLLGVDDLLKSAVAKRAIGMTR